MKKPAVFWNIFNINLPAYLRCCHKPCVRGTATLAQVGKASSLHPKPTASHFPVPKYYHRKEVHLQANMKNVIHS